MSTLWIIFDIFFCIYLKEIKWSKTSIEFHWLAKKFIGFHWPSMKKFVYHWHERKDNLYYILCASTYCFYLHVNNLFCIFLLNTMLSIILSNVYIWNQCFVECKLYFIADKHGKLPLSRTCEYYLCAWWHFFCLISSEYLTYDPFIPKPVLITDAKT